MSTRGKVASGKKDRVRDGARPKPMVEVASVADARAKEGCSCGCKDKGEGRDVTPSRSSTPSRNGNGRPKVRPPRRNDALVNSARAVSLARRQA
jgi:hypothetical protein